MKKKANELIFISKINRDGSGVEILMRHSRKVMMIDKKIKLIRLSISEGTYITSGMMNVYIVKLKDKEVL